MSTLYNPRGFISPWLRYGAKHFYRIIFDSEYRFLQFLSGRIGRRARYQPGVFQFKGLPVHYVDAASLLSAWDEIFVNRIYDIGEARDPYFVDCGANVGLAELYWKCRYPNFSSVCFEPDPEIFQVLAGNLRAWQCATVPREEAVGAKEGMANFLAEGGDAGKLAQVAAVNAKGRPVRVTTLSPHLDRPVDLLKIDIEGAELAVLEECRASLHNVKRVFVETHSFRNRDQDFMDVMAILKESGFRCYLEVAVGGKAFFQRGSAGAGDIDLGLNVYGVRV